MAKAIAAETGDEDSSWVIWKRKYLNRLLRYMNLKKTDKEYPIIEVGKEKVPQKARYYFAKQSTFKNILCQFYENTENKLPFLIQEKDDDDIFLIQLPIEYYELPNIYS